MDFDNNEESLEFINHLLERLHQADFINHGSKIEIVYVASGGQHVETQIIASPYPPPTGGGKPLPNPGLTPNPSPKGEGDFMGGRNLPEVLATEEAMALWEKVQAAGYVDANYQPLLSRTQSALLADTMATRLGIREKWKVFEALWNRKYMRSDYNLALTQQQSLDFQDELKSMFE